MDHSENTWQERVLDEAKDLFGKLEKLTDFMEKVNRRQVLADMEEDERAALGRQRTAMIEYFKALQDRISRF